MTTRPAPRSPAMQEIGRLFHLRRKEKNVSLKDLSTHMNRSINTIRWHEAGARSLRADDLVKAAELIGCAPSALMPDEVPHDPAPVA